MCQLEGSCHGGHHGVLQQLRRGESLKSELILSTVPIISCSSGSPDPYSFHRSSSFLFGGPESSIRAAGRPQPLLYGWHLAHQLGYNIGGTHRVIMRVYGSKSGQRAQEFFLHISAIHHRLRIDLKYRSRVRCGLGGSSGRGTAWCRY